MARTFVLIGRDDTSSKPPGAIGRWIVPARPAAALVSALVLLVLAACSPDVQPSPPTAAATVVPTARPTPGVKLSIERLPEPTPRPLPTTVPTAIPTPEPPKPAFPVAVMVENSPDARPQSGLARADVLYEAPVEGGISRFMAVFVNGVADNIGPVRSARHYFVYLAAEYNASLVHIGSSPQGYEALDATGLVDLDETYGDPGFWRIKGRAAPHNSYTSLEVIRDALAKVRKVEPGGVAGFKFLGSASPAPRGEPAPEVKIDYPGGDHLRYVYSPEQR
ncbi:MAG TPA: DUF3048 domain-containing protein, partial [Chloroflexota bacterium]